MSYLDKVFIQGIRNFGAEEGDGGYVKFLTPLTLILGENGCGKTTIIEALKYATCGDLPLNTKSGSCFLHDPKLDMQMETRACVKLRIWDVKGQHVEITRLMQVMQKLKKLQFQSLDHTITRKDENEKSVTLSSKCVDVNEEMCHALGVSKAILNYVIFCHQEESNWPLEEGQKLKERFDAIFDSAKYNKCLDHIRKLRKEYMERLKVMKTDLKYLSDYKEVASNKRARLAEEETRMASSKDIVKTYKEKLIPIQERLKKLAEKEDHITQLHTENETLKIKLESVRNAIEEYKTGIQYEFQGSKSDLMEAIRNFQKALKDKQEKIDSLERNEETIIREQRRHQITVSEEQRKFGQLSRDFDRNKEKIEMRNRAVVQLCDDLKIDTSLSQLSQSDEIRKVFAALELAMNDNFLEEKRIKTEQAAEVKKLQDEINSILENKSSLKQIIENKRSELAKTKAEARKVKADIEEVDQSADKLGLLQAKLDRVKKELDELVQSNEMENLSKEIKESEKERENYEDKLSLVEKEIQQLQALSSLQAQIDVQKEEKSKKDAEIRKLKSRHEESLKHLLKEVPEQGLKFQLQGCIDKLVDDIKIKKEATRTLSNKIATLESEKKHVSEKLRNVKQSLAADESAISQACGEKDYENYLTEVSKKVQELQDQKGTYSSSEYMFRRYVQKLQQREPCCPLCHRNFSAEDEVTQLISELTLKVKELPSKLRGNKQQLDTMQEKYKSLLQLKPKFEKLSTIKHVDIPKLESELEEIEEKLESSQQELLVIQAELVAPQSDESLAKSIQGDIVLLEQYISDSRHLSWEIQKLEAKLPSGSGSRSLQEALNEQKDLRTSIQSLRRTIESCQIKNNSIISRRNQLQENKNTIQDQQMKISGNVQMRSQLSERRDELESMEGIINMEIEKGMEDLATSSRLHDQTTRQMKMLIANNENSLEIIHKKNRKLDKNYESLKKLDGEVQDYEKSGGRDKLTAAQANLSSMEHQMDTLQAKKEALCDEKDKLKTDLATQMVRERELDDNLKLRQKLEEEEELKIKISEMRAKLGNLDFSSLNSERNKLREEEEKIHRDKAHAEGRQRELENTICNLKAEMSQDHLKNADKKYRDKLIDLKVGELAVADLNQYYTAMDWAVMHYHKERMQHINFIIRDLWRTIYCGNDIDYIEIKTDEDPSISADKKRTYNYRVVEMKNGIEMDMRGRCSTGQKVLACLIIRMALAETFSPNCGVLALDEPTTNLDEKNINSLNHALSNIVLKRRRQKNFQLIVITHDRKFLDFLSEIDQVTHYYEVKRNEKGTSMIQKVNIEHEEGNSMEF